MCIACPHQHQDGQWEMLHPNVIYILSAADLCVGHIECNCTQPRMHAKCPFRSMMMIDIDE